MEKHQPSTQECSTSSKTAVASTASVSLLAKWGKKRITLSNLEPTTTILQVKEMLTTHTNILPKRQKLVGLGKVHDTSLVSELKFKKANKSIQEFILMGTPEEEIFVDPSEKDNLPDVIDDFELDFNAGSEAWIQHVATGENLKNFTQSTMVHVMNEPRQGKPLLVLDLDHTLLDFSSRQLQSMSSSATAVSSMKRPHMDHFLSVVYQHYDLVVWSQTSWRWLETKLTELGMLTNPSYKFCFVLDKTSMFAITSTKKDGSTYKHHVKPLQIIWSKFQGRWGEHNTVHVDDLRRNFALNLKSGLKVSAYHRKKSASRQDAELLGLARYLEMLKDCKDFTSVDFGVWMEVCKGSLPLTEEK